VTGQNQALADLTPGKAAGTHYRGGLGGWEGSRTSQHGFREKKASLSSDW